MKEIKRCRTCKRFSYLNLPEATNDQGSCSCNSRVLKNARDAACKEYERK